MDHLTRREQVVLWVLVVILLTGWGVKAFFAAHRQVQPDHLQAR